MLPRPDSPHPGAEVARPAGRQRPEVLTLDFDERPFTVAWELTRACALACVHCRAEAQPQRHPEELSTAEALGVVDQLADLAPPVLVLTGGDPLMRPDLFELAGYAIQRGLRVAVSPTTTVLVTRERLERLRDLGVSMVHISLDGADAETHDGFRGVAGTYDRAIGTLEALQGLRIPVQVGTTLGRHNLHQMDEMATLVGGFGVRMWSVFFLVPTGRATARQMITAPEAEAAWDWLAALSERAPFAVRTTAAPQYRRTMMLRARARGGGPVRLAGAGYQIDESVAGPRMQGVNDGKGFLFIDHRGNLCPSGFLQLSAGNVRTDPIASVYRESPLFRSLRDPSQLTGRCGRCTFAELCGGSRARAFATSGDYLGDDPLCMLDIPRERADTATTAG
ncbi:MAG: mycofactocin radical SAM maturase [Chloroflexota bacterium]